MPAPHILSVFDQDMDRLQAQILSMGGLVEEAIRDAALALETRDDELAARVVEGDKKIDALEEDINTAVVRVLALRSPAAGDLRTVITVMKVAGDLERLGDYAKNLGKRVPILAQAHRVEGAAASIKRLAKSVRLMLKDALDGYARKDLDLVRDVLQRDVEVDQMTNALFREFLTHMMEDPRSITSCMHLLFISKNLERMGDHVTEICEQIIYLETGTRPEARPKGTSTAQVDVPYPGSRT
ncbi:phosphate signaling complex protein PhoU [Roseicitreum antarcticum]|uniref:Phosphate-specific transport system accessory protein PhoU n=1 Tax=Roseicitreum antarcticum TaxID=564137 RepID=A0A1H2QR41_9RHOB|nr:phosphate signaling complex protein PhoU [Roseicitreum antarcticum]SDW09611.1 phosphate transport system protein [Roseicitreum antarcticum]